MLEPQQSQYSKSRLSFIAAGAEDQSRVLLLYFTLFHVNNGQIS